MHRQFGPSKGNRRPAVAKPGAKPSERPTPQRGGGGNKGAQGSPVPTAATTPTVTVSSSGGTTHVTTSGFGSQKAAKRAVRAQKRRARRVQRIATEARRDSARRASRRPAPPKKYTPPKALPKPSKASRQYEPDPAKAVISSVPSPNAKPETFQGAKTAGEPSRRELQKAAKAGTLRVNQRGFATTPEVRKVGGELRQLRKKARRSNAPLPGLGPEESKVARKVLRTGKKKGATRKELLAAAETGLVESGFKNLGYGDADSEGWRQERTSIYGTAEPRNVKAGAANFFSESVTDTGGTRGRGMTAGELAQAIQGSAYPERYDERKPEAAAILKAFERGGLKPGQQKRLQKVSKKARKLGLKAAKPKGAASPSPKKFPGAFEGSRDMVRKIVGTPVRGDKEYGHSTGGDHQPVAGGGSPAAYAQDINGDNPSEHEPPYTQGTLDKITKNLRKLGADVPHMVLGDPTAGNWEGVVKGYRIQILTNEGGEVSHIHVGARYTGDETSSGSYSGGGSSAGVTFGATDITSYASATGQSVAAVQKKLHKGKLTGLQILKRLERLGVGVGETSGVGESSTATSRSSDPVLAEMERKYLGAAA